MAAQAEDCLWISRGCAAVFRAQPADSDAGLQHHKGYSLRRVFPSGVPAFAGSAGDVEPAACNRICGGGHSDVPLSESGLLYSRFCVSGNLRVLAEERGEGLQHTSHKCGGGLVFYGPADQYSADTQGGSEGNAECSHAADGRGVEGGSG